MNAIPIPGSVKAAEKSEHLNGDESREQCCRLDILIGVMVNKAKVWPISAPRW